MPVITSLIAESESCGENFPKTWVVCFLCGLLATRLSGICSIDNRWMNVNVEH